MGVRAAVRQARQKVGLTVERAAQLAGYKSKAGWAMVELGYNDPDPERMIRMAKACNAKVQEMFPEFQALLNGLKEAAGDG